MGSVTIYQPQFWVYPAGLQGSFSIFLRFFPRKGYKTLPFGKNPKNFREISSEYLRDKPKTEVIKPESFDAVKIIIPDLIDYRNSFNRLNNDLCHWIVLNVDQIANFFAAKCCSFKCLRDKIDFKCISFHITHS